MVLDMCYGCYFMPNWVLYHTLADALVRQSVLGSVYVHVGCSDMTYNRMYLIVVGHALDVCL